MIGIGAALSQPAHQSGCRKHSSAIKQNGQGVPPRTGNHQAGDGIARKNGEVCAEAALGLRSGENRQYTQQIGVFSTGLLWNFIFKQPYQPPMTSPEKTTANAERTQTFAMPVASLKPASSEDYRTAEAQACPPYCRIVPLAAEPARRRNTACADRQSAFGRPDN